jgi:hypothetical protein
MLRKDNVQRTEEMKDGAKAEEFSNFQLNRKIVFFNQTSEKTMCRGLKRLKTVQK